MIGGEKQTHCDPDDPADANRGDWWDHVAYDPEHRLVLCVVPGARDVECVEEVVDETKQRTGGRVMRLMTSDAYSAYETAILAAYGQEVTTTPSGRESRRLVPEKVPPPDLNYAVVEKRREKGRVVEVLTRVVFGTMAAVLAALGQSRVSRWINVSFLERQNATDRHRNARKVRKAYTFSKDWQVHESMTYFTMYSVTTPMGHYRGYAVKSAPSRLGPPTMQVGGDVSPTGQPGSLPFRAEVSARPPFARPFRSYVSL
jgi:IS1 family transposase